MRQLFSNLAMRLSDLGGAMVAPFERIIGGGVRGLFGVGEGLERVEGLFYGLWRLVTWPFRMIGRGVAGLFRLVVPESLAAGAEMRVAGWRTGFGRMGHGVWAGLERLNLDAPLRWLAWLLQPVWRPIAGLGGFTYAWLVTRPYRQMAWGLPAVVLLVPIAGAAAWALTWGRGSVETHYRVAVKDAREAKDYATLDLLEQKLAALGVDTDRNEYEVATKLAEEEGKLEDAYAVMQRLAPEDELGLPQAHYWILLRLLTGELDLPEDERLRLAGLHLAHLEDFGAKGDEVDILRAGYLEQVGKLEEAAELLEPMINRVELAALQRLQLDLRLKRTEEVKRDAAALHEHLAQAQRKGEPFDVQRWQAMAQTGQILGNQPLWSRAVREWLKLAPDDPEARRNVAALDQIEFASMLQSGHANAQELAARLSEAMRLIDKPQALEAQITALYGQRRQSRAVTEMFTILMESDATPTPLVACLGALAAIDGDVPLARRLLERAVAGDPQNPVAWNNLAWALSKEPQRDLDQALVAVNRALELMPKEFRFRETRGQILLALGQWQAAVDDLEFALNGMPDSADVHAGLATAFEKLGQTDLATIHRQQAE